MVMGAVQKNKAGKRIGSVCVCVCVCVCVSEQEREQEMSLVM